jgi:hypothetical protein
MKRWSFYLVMVALVLAIVAPASAELLFDRGLPTANLNGLTDPDRSNVTWADGNYASVPDSYWLPGDDFKIGTSGLYNIETIRVWSTTATGLSLYFGEAGGTSFSQIATNPAVSSVTYSDGTTYQGSSGSFRQLYQVDFAITNLNITGGQTYQFFLDAPFTQGTDNLYANGYLHASNAALSVSSQEGANDFFLWLPMTNGLPDPATMIVWDSHVGGGGWPGGWDKTSDGNVQVFGSPVPIPGALVLLGAGLVRLARYGRRKKALI